MRTRPRLQSHLPNPCPVVGCIANKKPGQVMCRSCWQLLSIEERASVNSTWRDVRMAARGGDVTEKRFALLAYKRATQATIEAAGWVRAKELPTPKGAMVPAEIRP